MKSSSYLISSHVKKRLEGLFADPRVELHAIEGYLDNDELSPLERSWANRRRRVLLKRIEIKATSNVTTSKSSTVKKLVDEIKKLL